MLAIRLPQSIEKRLERLARRTGRTKTFYAREAILRHLDEIENGHGPEAVRKRGKSRKRRSLPIESNREPMVRRLSEAIRLARKRGSKATIDADFAADVRAAVESHPEPLEPPAWE